MEKRPLDPNWFYEDRRTTPRWRDGVLPSAGLYLLDGAYHAAVYGTAEEQRLFERGALLVAGVRFDGLPMEAPPPAEAHLVSVYPASPSPLGHKRTVERLGWTPTRN
ncbi:MAG TPA: hypothetical protein VF746_10125 [Longimicrobium sp.]|jgi:hypothetical protein